VCQRTGIGDHSPCSSLLSEGLQIARIIAAIIINTKNNDDNIERGR
jgi:hypothetical protein